MKKTLAKIFGKYLSKKAGLYDGTPTKGKVWYKSKTILGSIVVLVRALYSGASVIVEQVKGVPLPDIPPVVDTLLLGVLGGNAIKGRVEAHKPIVIDEYINPKKQEE